MLECFGKLINTWMTNKFPEISGNLEWWYKQTIVSHDGTTMGGNGWWDNCRTRTGDK